MVEANIKVEILLLDYPISQLFYLELTSENQIVPRLWNFSTSILQFYITFQLSS